MEQVLGHVAKADRCSCSAATVDDKQSRPGFFKRFLREAQVGQEVQHENVVRTYERVNGRSWDNDRDALATVTKRSFAKAYAEQFGGSEDDAIKVINDAKDSYRLSIEGFASRVKEYLASQPPGFRLNFFVDEAGQWDQYLHLADQRGG